MRGWNKIFIVVIMMITTVFIGANTFLFTLAKSTGGRPYRVEVERIVREIEQNDIEHLDISQYKYVINVEQYRDGDRGFFEDSSCDYLVRQINGKIYRFDYIFISESKHLYVVGMVNIILAIMSLVILSFMLFIRQKILQPFYSLCDVPYELSKGNLTVPIRESKNRFFGRFVWGINMLREKMEQQKQKELDLQRDKKTLVLSISHDIKTPLSAIKLYSKALSKGLYTDINKQTEIAESINDKADEIEEFVTQIIKASNEDFLNLEVNQDEFYLSELVNKISVFYKEKLDLIKIPFLVDEYSDCILKGDFDRCIEVLQNIIENAVKYGDGYGIEMGFSGEDDCKLVVIKNSGCTLSENELPHVFESFWRGSNSGSHKGSGLGLYICRQLMRKMDGEVFADIQGGFMCMSVAFRKSV